MWKMVSKKIGMLTFLYFIQGLPYGLQARFLPIYLRTRGMSLTNVGFFKLLLVPWMCKAFWAPFVDRYSTKKHWLVWSMAILVITCLIGSLINPQELTSLAAVLLLLNLATSTQDIAVDGLAIQILSTSELAEGNIAQVVGYKLGAIVGGGVFLWLSSHVTWFMLFLGLTGTYAIAILIVLYAVDANSGADNGDRHSQTIRCDNDENIHDENGSEDTCNLSTNMEDLGQDSSAGFETPPQTCEPQSLLDHARKHFSDILNTDGTIWIIVYVLLYKLGEMSALNMLPLFMVDQNVSAADVGFWTGIAGQVFSIAGSVMGGWLISYYKYSPLQVVKYFCTMRVLPLVIQLTVISLWPTSMLSPNLLFVLAVFSMSGLLFISGLVTTATFTLMMQCSQHAPTTVQASHYTTLATLEVMGKLTFSVVTGPMVDAMGYQLAFVIFIALAISVLLVFRTCPRVLTVYAGNKNH